MHLFPARRARLDFSLSRTLLRLAGLALLGLGLATQVHAEEKAKDAGAVIFPHGTETRAEPVAGRGPGYAGILTAAALLAGAGGWLVWRNRVAPGRTINVRKLAIAETKSLGNRQYLVVATYEDRKFLLGVCPGRIDLLTPLDGTSAAKNP